MGCQHWTEYRRLFLISNFLLIVMLLCLTSLFLPYWYVVDFYPEQDKTRTKITVVKTPRPTTTTVNTINTNPSSTPASTSPLNLNGRRKKREVSFEQTFGNKILSRKKRQAINQGRIFDDLVIPKVHVGLFFMLYPYADFMKLEILSTRMISLIHLEKNSPDFVVPSKFLLNFFTILTLSISLSLIL